MPNGRYGREHYGPDFPSSTDCIERVASSSNVLGVTIALAQTFMDLDCVKPLSGIDPPLPSKTKKITVERSDSKRYVGSAMFHLSYLCSLYYRHPSLLRLIPFLLANSICQLRQKPHACVVIC